MLLARPQAERVKEGVSGMITDQNIVNLIAVIVIFIVINAEECATGLRRLDVESAWTSSMH
jgi:hypothetical protein